jgi:lysophospholipase L1-like esterase
MPTSQPTMLRHHWRNLAVGACLVLVMLAPLPAATATIPLPAPGLPANARLALCGDSITEQRLYTAYVEAYLLACAGRPDVSVFQFGWGGENADQFRNRVGRGDLDAFMPTAVSIAYGANDGGGQPWQEWMQAMWNGRVRGVLAALAARYPASAAHTVICSPTWFQAAGDGGNAAATAASNDTLGRFRDLDLAVARERSTGFADFHQRMRDSGGAALAALGPGFRFGGSDGVHPGANGHLLMAHELLKALDCDGAIAIIACDAAGGGATASAGHTVLGAGGGMLRLSSVRWPFCTAHGGTAAADHLATILPYLPFNQELNRFTLVVRGLGAAGASITWGQETRAFSAQELESGVNLAAAFARTPFDAPFARLMTLIATKQAKERDMIKAAGDPTAPAKAWTPADVAARDALDAAVHAALVAVEHVIVIAPLRAGAATTP